VPRRRRPLLTKLGQDKRLQFVGINYKDAGRQRPALFSAATAIRSASSAVDGNGRASIEWGVYGVPETFVVGREGTIVYKMVGPGHNPTTSTPSSRFEIEKALKGGVLSHRPHPEERASSPRLEG